ncbi:MAG: response regulator [Rhizomicrobium sp.]|jgi:CheY-like chemotaxis protein
MVPLAPRNRSLRILCIEEEDVQRKLLNACLDVVGAEAVFAMRAEDALFLFRRHPMDMVFMDIDLHSAEELAAFERMRATPRREHVPILALTENECAWPESAYREAGFAGVFLKPIEPMRLFRMMDDVLREAEQPPLLANQPDLFGNARFA